MAENCLGFYLYKGECENLPESPAILTRIEKGQALSHVEMDFNVASLLHTASLTEAKEAEEITLADWEAFSDGAKNQKLQEKRAKEWEGLEVEFGYVPIVENGSQKTVAKDGVVDFEVEGDELARNKPIHYRNRNSTTEILEKVADERIPGDLDIQKTLYVSESVHARENGHIEGNLYVTGSTYITGSTDIMEDLHVHKDAEVLGNTRIVGDLIVEGRIFGNIAVDTLEGYFTKDYKDPIVRNGKFVANLDTKVHPNVDELLKQIELLRAEVSELRKIVTNG